MPPNRTGLTITNPLVLYRSLLATKQISPDPAQHRLALRLQRLYEDLKDYEPTIEYNQRLQQLSRAISAGQKNNDDLPTPSRPADHSSIGARGIWSTLLAHKEKRDSLALTRVLTSHDAALSLQSPRGLMLHGEVGTGKSMLIDLFCDCLPNRKKRRWHFNTFMLETISRLESLRKARSLGPGAVAAFGADEHSLLWLARDLIETSPILFLDEFQLPDRAAAKILSNLMTSFFQLGGVLVATSNRMPEELAKAAGMEFARPVSTFGRLGWRMGLTGGVTGRHGGSGQKGEFAQFLEVLRARCEVWEMEGKSDYRRLSGGEDGIVRSVAGGISGAGVSRVASSPGEVLSTNAQVNEDATGTAVGSENTVLPRNYLIQPPATAESTRQAEFASAVDSALSAATSSTLPIPWEPDTLTVYGRALSIPRQHSGTAYFTFDELCGATLGPADFITIASTYHTLILTSVPILTFLQKNEARRFITLLDALYEARCRLLITASAGPDDIFFPEAPATTSKTSGQDSADLLTADAVHPETYSEIHQDLTAPFRPNISSYGSSSSSQLADDALEDDPPNRFRRPGSSFTDERKLAAAGAKAPDFANLSGLTGEDERFAVKRARSRIWEMTSAKWWARAATGGETSKGDRLAGEGWWRPLPLASRHWEHSGLSSSRGTREDSERVAWKSDVRSMGSSREKVDQELFPHGASPFRTASEPPPQIGWTHVWGTVKWGKKAGAWGKGVEGLEERKMEKRNSSSEGKSKP